MVLPFGVSKDVLMGAMAVLLGAVFLQQNTFQAPVLFHAINLASVASRSRGFCLVASRPGTHVLMSFCDGSSSEAERGEC